MFVVAYDDFNPFLDRFRDRFSGRRRKPERVLAEWRLWDHIDADFVAGGDAVGGPGVGGETGPASGRAATSRCRWNCSIASQARDLLLLAACYDQSTAETPEQRWQQLQRKLRFPIWRSKWDLALGIARDAGGAGAVRLVRNWHWFCALSGRGWRLPPAGCRGRGGWLKWQWTGAADHPQYPRARLTMPSLLRRMLMHFTASGSSSASPCPTWQRTDDRYELLGKLQGAAADARISSGIVVLVDRVDEPYLINGSAELMQALIWPMLDNKFLKHPGMGVKLLLPIELERQIDRQDRDFHQRARLDKQNMIRSLDWTGQSLYDLANARLKACAAEQKSPTIDELFEHVRSTPGG